MSLLQQLSTVVLVLCVLVGMNSFSTKPSGTPDVYYADQADDALGEAKKLFREAHQTDARLLAPGLFEAAMLSYNETRIMRAQHRENAAVLENAVETIHLFTQALRQANKNRVVLSETIQMRESAGQLPANDQLKEIWREADTCFLLAASEYESNRPQKAEQASKEAQQLYYKLLIEAKNLLE